MVLAVAVVVVAMLTAAAPALGATLGFALAGLRLTRFGSARLGTSLLVLAAASNIKLSLRYIAQRI